MARHATIRRYRTKAPRSIRVVATCVMQDRGPGSHIWFTYGEPFTCRGSLGREVLTLFMPGGAVYRIRVPDYAADPMQHRYRKSTNRDHTDRLVITIKPETES